MEKRVENSRLKGASFNFSNFGYDKRGGTGSGFRRGTGRSENYSNRGGANSGKFQHDYGRDNGKGRVLFFLKNKL